jgi:hypothetical protein
LDGRTNKNQYQLILRLSNMELKSWQKIKL